MKRDILVFENKDKIDRTYNNKHCMIISLSNTHIFINPVYKSGSCSAKRYFVRNVDPKLTSLVVTF